MPKNNEIHRSHSHAVETSLYRLRNVSLTATHELIRCKDDSFFGWVKKGEKR